jgi:hypothetical protein
VRKRRKDGNRFLGEVVVEISENFTVGVPEKGHHAIRLGHGQRFFVRLFQEKSVPTRLLQVPGFMSHMLQKMQSGLPAHYGDRNGFYNPGKRWKEHKGVAEGSGPDD